jgi:hypothetical protein
MPATAPANTRLLTSWWVAIGIVAVLGSWMLWKGWRESQAQEEWTVPTTTAGTPPRQCRIGYPDSSDPVLVFPTEYGYLDTMSVRGARDAVLFDAVATEAGAFRVDSGTPCSMFALNASDPAKVTILDGPYKGRTAWVAVAHALKD